MIDNDISEEVFKRIQHKANVRGNVRNKIYSNNPQDKMLDYLTELELRIENLERLLK